MLTMAGLSFSEAESILLSSEVGDIICCIASDNGLRCKNKLPSGRVQGAKVIYQKDESTSLETDRLRQVRNLIVWLICESHRQKRGCTKSIERTWQSDFPGLNFEIRTRSEAPESTLSRSRSSTPLKTTSSDQSMPRSLTPLRKSPSNELTPGISGRPRTPTTRRPRSSMGPSRVSSDHAHRINIQLDTILSSVDHSNGGHEVCR